MTKKKSDLAILTEIANNQGFELYGSFNEGLQHDIFTCLKGKYDGEVIDIYWDYNTGEIKSIDYSTQTKGQKPMFTFNRYWDASHIKQASAIC